MEYLDGKENVRVMKLWRECFPEDSEEFIQYYIENKLSKNLVLARSENGEVISMLHLTPYEDNLNDKICYIVGVATDERYRRKGYMDSLMKKALKIMFLKGMPYTFLMPAKAEYYLPYGFSFIHNRKKTVLKPDIMTAAELEGLLNKKTSFQPKQFPYTMRAIDEKDAGKAALLAARLLRKQYELFLYRTSEYYKILIRELECQKGALIGLYNKERLVGLLAVSDRKGTVQEFLAEKEETVAMLLDEGAPTPAIMGRILNVSSVFGKVYSDKEIVLSLKVKDEIIPENNGVFLIHCGPVGGYLEAVRLADEDIEKDGNSLTHCECETTIEDLTSFLFGFRTAEACFGGIAKAREKEILQRLNDLAVLKRIQISELV